MIPISEEAKSKYIKDSTPKNLRIAYAKKDISEISNINMGLPVNHVIYQTGVMGTQATMRYYSANYYAFGTMYSTDIQAISASTNLFISFIINLRDMHTEYLKQDPKWVFSYVDGLGNSKNLYYPIPDASIYKLEIGQYENVQLNFYLPNGLSRVLALYLDCYDLSLLPAETFYEGMSLGQYRILYSNPSAYNVDNIVLLKDIPDFDPEPYNFNYIEKGDFEEESFNITESLSSKDNLKYGLCEASVCEFTVVDYNGIEVGDLIYPEMWLDGVENSTIPLGVFVVHSINVQYEGVLEKKSITAYSKITNLENKATDWNTIYMYGVNTETEDGTYTGRGFEYARQLYSSVFNALKFFGIDGAEKYSCEKVAEHGYSVNLDTWIKWSVQTNYYYKLYYTQITVSNPDTSARYFATYVNALDANNQPLTDEYIIENYMPNYTQQVDALGRGFGKGDILVEETNSIGMKHRYLVDRGDAFMVSANCTSLVIRIPALCRLENGSGSVFSTWQLINSVQLYKITDYVRLTNGAERLMYYNYMSREIFPIDSSATGRDVVRSILEMCGCFFGLDRTTGLPRFVYPDKAGLYPSDTLYPSDDLYPRSGVDDLFAGGKYISLRAENYTVASIGKIQIVKSEESNEVKSAVWEHVGSNAPNTYVIDDNIYYCAEDMEYDYDLMIDVSRVLVNMFFEITNTYFTPFKATAIGIPWEECGDRIAFETHHGDFETFIFRRKLKGIDALKDTFEAKSDKITEGVNTYLYTQEEE